MQIAETQRVAVQKDTLTKLEILLLGTKSLIIRKKKHSDVATFLNITSSHLIKGPMLFCLLLLSHWEIPIYITNLNC